jgi:hypothetical protein
VGFRLVQYFHLLFDDSKLFLPVFFKILLRTRERTELGKLHAYRLGNCQLCREAWFSGDAISIDVFLRQFHARDFGKN